MISNCACDLIHATGAVAAVRPYLQRIGVIRIWLFGSRLSGEADCCSDWDLCLEFSRPIQPREYRVLSFYLRRAIEGRVDICSPQYSSPDFISCIADNTALIYSDG